MEKTDPFFDTLNKTINSQLLKYAAGQQIFCPVCKEILDWKTIVIVEAYKGDKLTGKAIICNKCFKPAGIPKLEEQGVTVEVTEYKP